MISRRELSLAAMATIAAGMTRSARAQNADPIKIGILHSLSGTMAISETTLKDVMLSICSSPRFDSA